MIRAFATLIVTAAAALVLASCETMSAEECAAADWQALGYEDAARSGATRFADRSESCAEKGITADFNAYQAGQVEGLYAFCQPRNAFHFAMNGGSFNGSCPGELRQEFGYAFADGQRIYAATQEVERARSEISRLESERYNIDEDIRSRERTIANQETTEEERRRLRGEIDNLRRRRRDVNDDLGVAQERVHFTERAADDVRYQIGNRWGNW